MFLSALSYYNSLYFPRFHRGVIPEEVVAKVSSDRLQKDVILSNRNVAGF